MLASKRRLGMLAVAALGLSMVSAVVTPAAVAAPTGSTSITVFLKAPNVAALDRLASARNLTHAQRVAAVTALLPSAAAHREVRDELSAQGFQVTGRDVVVDHGHGQAGHVRHAVRHPSDRGRARERGPRGRSHGRAAPDPAQPARRRCGLPDHGRSAGLPPLHSADRHRLPQCRHPGVRRSVDRRAHDRPHRRDPAAGRLLRPDPRVQQQPRPRPT